MIFWKDVLHPVNSQLSKESTLLDALALLENTEAGLLLVSDRHQEIIGYIDRLSLLQQIHEAKNLNTQITYHVDILKVPELSPISFYHNITVVLGMNEEGSITGYTTTQEARLHISQYKLHQLNQIFNSSGTGMITTDSNFDITFMNETAEQILGLPRSVLLDRNYKTLLTLERDLEEVLTGKQLLGVKGSINTKWITGNFSPLYENGKIIGVVHIFSPWEQGEEASAEPDIRLELEDLSSVYSADTEQMIVINHEGKIIRIAGTFLQDFWQEENPEHLVGKDIYELEAAGIFRPNIAELCLVQRKKISMIQEPRNGRKVWSVATPVFQGDKIEKVVILSRDITEINQLRAELEQAIRKSKEYKQELDELLTKQDTQKKLIFRSQVMERLVDELIHISKVDSTVLLIGESGVGKEVFAQAIHEYSPRRNEAFIRVNCGAIPENLMESEMFGYEKGAFTGADLKGKPGLFELAHKGTIFLDEVTDLPYNMQVKLLRVLQEREIMRVGGTKTVPVDVRVIAATNQNIKELVAQQKFREDLYYRLHVIPIEIPPLRKRTLDIVPLSIHFLKQFNAMYKLEKSLTRDALDALERHDWPGNVRELQNVVERLIVTARTDVIDAPDVISNLYGRMNEFSQKKTLVQEIMPLKEAVEEVESQLIAMALQKYGTAYKVAQVLGVSPATVSRRMQKLL